MQTRPSRNMCNLAMLVSLKVMHLSKRTFGAHGRKLGRAVPSISYSSQLVGTIPYTMYFSILILMFVGGQLQFSLTKGAFIHPPNLVTQSLLNTLSTIPKPAPEPRIIVISSIGITHSSHAKLPLLMKPVYSHLLASPHADKFGAERLLSHVCGRPWDPTEDGEPAEDIMGPDWMNKAGLPAHGSLKKVLVVRPAFLTDGDCKAEKRQSGDGKAPYRVSEEELGGYVVSRKDVAHFIAETALHNWDAYENKVVNVGY